MHRPQPGEPHMDSEGAEGRMGAQPVWRMLRLFAGARQLAGPPWVTLDEPLPWGIPVFPLVE